MGSGLRESLELFFNLRALAFPGELLGQFRIAMGQLYKPGMSLDGFCDELQVPGAYTLAVVGAVFVSLKAVVRPIGRGA